MLLCSSLCSQLCIRGADFVKSRSLHCPLDNEGESMILYFIFNV